QLTGSTANGDAINFDTVVSDDVSLHVSLYAGGKDVTATFAPQIDRVEFYANGSILGVARSLDDDGRYDLTWPTAALDGSGSRQFPDGSYTVEALAFPRPRSNGASPAIVELQPFASILSIRVDNPALPRVPTVAANLTSVNG